MTTYVFLPVYLNIIKNFNSSTNAVQTLDKTYNF